MRKIFYFILMISSPLFSLELHDKTFDGYTFEWNREEDFKESGNVYIDSFLFAYRGFTPRDLGVEEIESYLEGIVEEELEIKRANPNGVHWLIAKSAGRVIGLLILDVTKYPEVYAKRLAISPIYLRKGIATKLMQVVEESLPEAERIIAISHKVNKVGLRFFESLGFEKTNSINSGYDSNNYVGFEYIPENP